MKNVEKLIAAARRLAKEVDENGIPEDLEDGELAYMLRTLTDLCEQNKELVEVVKALVDRLEWLTHPQSGDTERPYINYANRVLEKFK